MTPATEEKRKQFKQFIEQVMVPETAVKAIVGIGSIATGRMRPDSDIDAIVFLEPYHDYIVPAEAIWDPQDDTFHSIFTDDAAIQARGIGVDFKRVRWSQWADPAFVWPEARRAELRQGWIAFDRTGQMAQVIAEHTAYPDDVRLARLDKAIVWLDQHLGWQKPDTNWQNLGPLIAHDRLQAAYHYLVQALFAYNRFWQPWRNREMSALLMLPWLPENFEERVLLAANAPTLDYDGYTRRVEAIRSLFNDLLTQVIENGDYTHVPIDQAFIRQHEEPGRAWNMDDWNKFRYVRQMSVQAEDSP